MHSSQGIVLKKIDVGETDGFFVMYTKEFGKIAAFGQGIKKESAKLKGHLEKFNLVSIQFVSGRQNERLTYAEAISLWHSIRGNWGKIKLASRLADLIDKNCHPGEADENLWKLLVESFMRLEKESLAEIEAQKFLGEFEDNLARVLGYGNSKLDLRIEI